MTYATAWLVLIGGCLALFLAILNIRGNLRNSAETDPLAPKWPFSPESRSLFIALSAFVPAFFGIISILHSDDLASTSLGSSVCLGMSAYFALRGTASARSPEVRRAGPPITTNMQFLIAGCYAIPVVVRYVI